VSILLGFTNLTAIPLLAALVMLLLPVFYGLKVWVTVLGGKEITLE
jgi:hypothetical protein